MGVRVVGSALVAGVTVAALSGCMFVTPQQTARSYTPSDGVNGTVGDVQIRNVFLVTGDGTSANLIGALSNSTGRDRTLTMQYATAEGIETAQVVVPADGLLSLRPGGGTQVAGSAPSSAREVTLDGIDAPKGGLFQVGFQSGGGDPVNLRLPVLTNSLPDYKTLTPTPVAPAITQPPSDQATPLPSESPEDGETLSPSQPPGP